MRPYTLIDPPELFLEPMFAMLQKENGVYSYRNASVGANHHRRGIPSDLLTGKWREKICQWSYNVVDQ
jgi:hypothetical protein